MGKRILLVDDEKYILKALERLFLDTDYEIFTADDGEQGLLILEKYLVDLVISDMRMQNMDGHQFLKKVKALYPSTTRVILSGYSDEKKVFNSIIDGSSHLYLFKPWDSEGLQATIANIFEVRKVFYKPELLNIVNGMENLSIITDVYHSVCKLIDQEASTIAIAKEIEKDPAITAAVLRIINSAFYSVKTGSVAQAITFLGLPVLKSIILSCSFLKCASINISPFTISNLTQHANAANLFMTKIYSELLRKPLPDNLATAGLLHNLGLVIMMHYFPEKYRCIVSEHFKQPQKNIVVLEKELFGISHGELGGYLLNWWGIPYPIVECALFHGTPLCDGIVNREAVCAMHLASNYAWHAIAPEWSQSLEVGIFPILGFSQSDCDKVLSNID